MKYIGQNSKILLLILTFVAWSYKLFPQIQQNESDSLLNAAYSLINSDTDEALKLFTKASLLEPNNILIKKQIGYLHLQKNEPIVALSYFEDIDKISPSDTIKLQIAYILNSLKRNNEALEYFKLIRFSSDPQISNKAESAILILEADIPKQQFPWWGEIYTSPYYDSRFENIFNFLQLKEGYYLTDNKIFSAYGSAQLTSDAKSKSQTSGQAPIIFSDNALILGLGVNIRQNFGLNLATQFGIGIDLLKKDGKFKTKEDFRTIISYSNGIYPPFAVIPSPEFITKPLLDFYSSVGYYSRYKNVIGYAAIKGGLRFFEWKKSAIDFYLRINVARDIEKEFYNNIIEFGPGLRFVPHHTFGLSFLAEFYRGNYLKVSSLPIPYNLSYNSFRFYLIFGRAL